MARDAFRACMECGRRKLSFDNDDFRIDLMLVEEFSQRLHDGAVQHADFLAVQRGVGRGDPIVLAVLHHVVGFAAHGEIGVADDAEAFFLFRQTRQEVDMSVHEHLVKLGKTAVNVFVLSAGVFGYFPVVLIGVALPDRAPVGARLKRAVFVIADADGRGVSFGESRLHRRQQECEQSEKKRRAFAHTKHFLCKVLLLFLQIVRHAPSSADVRMSIVFVGLFHYIVISAFAK